jgi:hypothetical protein
MATMRALSAEIASAKERLLDQRSSDTAALQALTGQTLASSLEETAASMAPLTSSRRRRPKWRSRAARQCRNQRLRCRD